MKEKEAIVKRFAKYCSQCNGQCCKRGVFTVFGWEMEKLSRTHKNFEIGNVSDERGNCKDIAINELCLFSKGDGCKLSIDIRPTDCLTYPFYPKLKEGLGEQEIDKFLIQKECPFHNEIANDKKLVKAVQHFWHNTVNNTSDKEIVDWIGTNGQWHEWYKNTVDVKLNNKNTFKYMRKHTIPKKIKALLIEKRKVFHNFIKKHPKWIPAQS